MFRNNIFRFLGPFFLLAALSSCTADSGDSGDAIAAPLDSIFGTMFADDEPGAIVLVAKGDSIIYDKGFGVADFGDGRMLTDTTLVNICSISKQFAAIALLKLQEEGKLSLDDSVSKYFPQFKAPFFNRITLRHLLSHTSGIPDTRPRTRKQWNKYIKNTSSAFANVTDYMLYSLTGESVKYMENLDSLAFEPGTAYEYQNPTYQLALPLIEQVTGAEFKAWMDSVIFAPAGMVKTEYLVPSVPQPELAHAYIPSSMDSANVRNYYRSPDGKWQECDYGEANFFPTKADGALYTTALEFLSWERALFSGKIIGEESLRQAFTEIIQTDIPDTFYGLGFFIEQLPGDRKKIYHTGDNGGFLTIEAYFPHSDVFYLIFANRPDWDREKTAAAVEKVLSDNELI